MVGLLTWAPNSTCKASPTILATVPSWANTISVMPERYSLSSGPSTLGSNVSTSAVETSDIGEKRCDLTALPTEIDGISIPSKTLGEGWREIPSQVRLGSFGFCLLLPNITKIFYVPDRLGDGSFQIAEIDRFGDKVKCATVHRGANIAHVAIGRDDNRR